MVFQTILSIRNNDGNVLGNTYKFWFLDKNRGNFCKTF